MTTSGLPLHGPPSTQVSAATTTSLSATTSHGGGLELRDGGKSDQESSKATVIVQDREQWSKEGAPSKESQASAGAALHRNSSSKSSYHSSVSSLAPRDEEQLLEDHEGLDQHRQVSSPEQRPSVSSSSRAPVRGRSTEQQDDVIFSVPIPRTLVVGNSEFAAKVGEAVQTIAIAAADIPIAAPLPPMPTQHFRHKFFVKTPRGRKKRESTVSSVGGSASAAGRSPEETASAEDEGGATKSALQSAAAISSPQQPSPSSRTAEKTAPNTSVGGGGGLRNPTSGGADRGTPRPSSTAGVSEASSSTPLPPAEFELSVLPCAVSSSFTLECHIPRMPGSLVYLAGFHPSCPMNSLVLSNFVEIVSPRSENTFRDYRIAAFNKKRALIEQLTFGHFLRESLQEKGVDRSSSEEEGASGEGGSSAARGDRDRGGGGAPAPGKAVVGGIVVGTGEASGSKKEFRSGVVPTPEQCSLRFEKLLRTTRKKFLRVVSFNVLASCYLRPSQVRQMYPYCDLAYVTDSYRFPLLGREILELDPDICCLQEVSAAMDKYMRGLLSETYLLAYKPKSVFSGKAEQEQEGCLMALKKSVFEIVDRRDIGTWCK